MERQYKEALLKKIQELQYYTNIHGVPVLIKPIPDECEEGMMDPRLYKDNKKISTMLRLVPKKLIKKKIEKGLSLKGVKKLRTIFDQVKSIPVASTEIQVTQEKIKSFDNTYLPIQIYQTSNQKENVPVLYYIHGGGFFGGHMGVVEQLMKMLVEKFSIIVVSIDYRLAPESPYPIGHQDCYTGLLWIHKHIANFGGDLNNIFVAGDSAGGTLAQYCTTKDLENDTHIIKAQLLLYPILNLGEKNDQYSSWNIDQYTMHSKHKKVITSTISLMAEDTRMVHVVKQMLGIKDATHPYISPYGMDVTNLPPTFITVGEHDYFYIECLAYAKQLVEANIDIKTVVYKGMGHAYGDNIGVYPQSEDCVIEMGSFIMEHSN